MNVNEFILKHSDTSLAHVLYNPGEHVQKSDYYDPAKAHEYYERNKHLKGRRRAVAKVSSGRSHAAVLLNKHHAKKVPVKSAKQRNAEAAAKIPNLQAKLDRLKSILSELVRQAKERAGVDTSKQTTSANLTKKAQATTRAKGTNTSGLTPQQKQEAAKRSQEWRDAHTTPEQKAQALEQQIADVTQKIKDMRAQAAAESPPPPTPSPTSTKSAALKKVASKPANKNKSTKPVPAGVGPNK